MKERLEDRISLPEQFREAIHLQEEFGQSYLKVELYLYFNEKPKILGKYYSKDKIFETNRNDNHILDRIDAFGFNYKFINENDIQYIIVNYKRKKIFTTKEYLTKHGKVGQFKNVDKQIFLPVEDFKSYKQHYKKIKISTKVPLSEVSTKVLLTKKSTKVPLT
ncbi:hypothetical protein ACFLSS_03770 [Bacteroidota bacterium]